MLNPMSQLVIMLTASPLPRHGVAGLPAEPTTASVFWQAVLVAAIVFGVTLGLTALLIWRRGRMSAEDRVFQTMCNNAKLNASHRAVLIDLAAQIEAKPVVMCVSEHAMRTAASSMGIEHTELFDELRDRLFEAETETFMQMEPR